MGGLVLERAVGEFSGFVVFQPIINGIGGNLVSVQASKISTMLHQSSLPGIIPPHGKIFEMPWRALFHGTPYARTARILILMSIPGQILFIFVADWIHMSRSTIGAPFVFSYMTVSLIQVSHFFFKSIQTLNETYSTDNVTSLHCSRDDPRDVALQDRPRHISDSISDSAWRSVRFQLAVGCICVPSLCRT